VNVPGMFVFTHITIRDDAVVSIYIYIYKTMCRIWHDVLVSGYIE